MEKRLINKHRMLIAVVDFLATNTARLTFAPAIATFIERLQDVMGRIAATQEAQLTSTVGKTQTKEALKKEAIGSILEIIKRAKAYSLVTKDLVLMDDVSYSQTQLDAMPQDSLVIAANKVINTCSGKVALMADYGLTAQLLADAGAKTELYAAALPGTKRAIATRKTAAADLKTLFAEADNLLETLDALMEIGSTQAPALIEEYRNNRVIDDLRGKGKTSPAPATGSTGITGTVGNMDTGLNQPGVKVSLTGTSFSTLTDADGAYTFTGCTPGTYTLNAELTGFTPYTEDDIEITEGELTEVDFDMEPLT